MIALLAAAIINCPTEPELIQWIGGDITPPLPQISSAVDAVEESPFVGVCRHDGALRNRPKTGLLRREVPFQDNAGRPTADFLNRIAARVDRKIAESERMLRSFKTCLENPNASRGCAELLSFLETELPEMIGKAREHLALAQTATDTEILKPIWNQAYFKPNFSLENLGVPKQIAWEPLDPNETKEVKRKFSEMLGPQTPNPYDPETRKRRESKLYEARIQHGFDYQKILSEFPILQYIKSAKPNRDELRAAVSSLQTHLAAEAANLKSIQEAIAEEKRTYKTRGSTAESKLTSMTPKALQILDYRSLVEAELFRSPEDCGLATSLLYTKENRETGNVAALTFPLMVASFFVSPVITVPAGIAAAASLTIKSHDELETAKNRSFSLYQSQDAQALQAVAAAQENYDFNLVAMPLALSGSSVAARKIATGLTSLKATAAAASRTTAEVDAAKKTLQNALDQLK